MCELLHVVTIAFHIPLQLGKSQIMDLQREEPQARSFRRFGTTPRKSTSLVVRAIP
jgi:hypothetical protein